MIKRYFILWLVSWAIFMFLLTDNVQGQAANISKDGDKYKVQISGIDVQIGDEGEGFKPTIILNKWNENALNLWIPDDLIKSKTPSIKDKTLKLKDSEREFYFKTEGDYLKFGLIFTTRPEVSKWEFRLEGWQFYDWFFQDTLENDFKNGVDVVPGDTLEKYLEQRKRPEEVVGSYALYHKYDTWDKSGTGKFGHFYRPKFIDADGKTAWAILHIENGIYSVEMPEDFRASAKLPIMTNDTFGYDAIGGTTVAMQTPRIYASGQGSPASDGTVVSLDYYSVNVSGSVDVIVGLYNDTAGAISTQKGSEK